MTNTERITRLSRTIRYVSYVLIAALPLFFIYFWLNVNTMPQSFIQHLPAHNSIHFPLPAQGRLLGFIVSLIPLAVHILMFSTIIKLFTLYEKSVVFALENVRLYRRLGILFVVQCFSSVVYNTLLTGALTLSNPPGQRMLSVSIGTKELSDLLTGAVIILISMVMEEAHKLKTESDLTI